MGADKTFLEEIKRKLSIEDVIRKVGGADLHGSGNTLTGWHKAHESASKNSLQVDTQKGVYHCFGCGQGGDIFTWVGHIRYNGTYTDTNKKMFADVLAELAQMAGIELPSFDREAAAERRSIEEIFALAASFYHDALPAQQRDWLHTRYGLTDETINGLKLGFAPATKAALFAHLHTCHKIAVGDLLKTGLFIQHDGNIQDHFQGRIMFPYWNGGRIVYFIGRETALSPQWEIDRGSMKYKKLLVHNDKHPYVSGQVRNSYFYAEDAARGADTLFVTEGVTDCIVANQYGFPCISPVTVRFRKADWSRLLELTSNAKTIYIANDNEASDVGGQGALDTAKMLWENGMIARMVTLPRAPDVDKVDLNDYLREQGADSFKRVLSSAKTLLDLKIEAAIAADTDDKKISIQKEVFSLIAHMSDVHLLDHWRATVPARMGLSKQSYDTLLKNASPSADHTAPTSESKTTDAEDTSKGKMWLDALRSLGYVFRLNALEDMVEVDGVRLDDITRSRIHIDMVSMGVSKTYVDDCINVIAGENTYHPVKKYLNGLSWDGIDRMEMLFTYIHGDDLSVELNNGSSHPLYQCLIYRWLVGCVARALDGDNESAFKHQTPMLVIIGKQGLGKSSFVRWLVSGIGYEYHRESPINPHNTDDIRSMVTKWIWEVSELGSSLRRGDRDALKGFITQEWHTYRKPWGKASITKPTLCNFIGTINPETGFLDDPTGHRRFLPVHITAIQHGYNTIDINQLWAQIVYKYRNGISPEMSDNERKALEGMYGEHEIENPLQTYLQMYFTIDPGNDKLRCFTADIMQRLRQFGINININSKVAGKEINDALAPLGLTRQKMSIDGVKGMGWVGIEPNQKLPPNMRSYP